MTLHGGLRDREPACDLRIRAALGDQTQDLMLPPSEWLLRHRPVTRQTDWSARVVIDAWRERLTDREDEILRLRSLDYVSVRPQLERAGDGGEWVLMRDDDQLAARRAELRPLEEPLPIESIAVDADHGDGKAALPKQLQRPGRRAGRRDLEFGGLESARERLQPDRFMVQYEYVLSTPHVSAVTDVDASGNVVSVHSLVDWCAGRFHRKGWIASPRGLDWTIRRKV